ncbi:MAG: response regulator transcription factor [Verrucomicrobiales bacterium]|nr:response regulator transcription factor [Verrucomicrobiales bacterium]
MRILVVEDECKVARFIEEGLREQAYAVDWAPDGQEGLYRALNNAYDLIVLDALLPKKDGFTLLREIRSTGSNVLVLMLTARASVRDRVQGLDAGADDYLTKPFDFDEFLARVRALLRRSTADGQLILRVADLELDPRTRKVSRAGRPLSLSAKQFSVLEFLLRNPNEVVTRTKLATHVWDENFDPFSNVIDVTMHHVREKVDREFSPTLIHTVRGVGYVLKVEGCPRNCIS